MHHSCPTGVSDYLGWLKTGHRRGPAVSEYRIVAKIEPQTAAGSQKVKQDLRGMQTEAKATEKSLDDALSKPKSSAVGEITKVKDGLNEVNRTSNALAKSGSGVSSALGGILNSTKGVAAESLRLNTILTDAKTIRSEERSEGKECGNTCRTRGWP